MHTIDCVGNGHETFQIRRGFAIVLGESRRVCPATRGAVGDAHTALMGASTTKGEG